MVKAAIILVGLLACVVVAAFWLKRSGEASADASEFPIIYNVANFMSATELKEVERTVRQRGEQYVISIAVVSSNNAEVHVGDATVVRPSSGRVYKVARTEGSWQIGGIESWKH
jgi:hypothetical protein